MFLLLRPTRARIESYLAGERGKPFSYAEVGASLATPPSGYAVDSYGTVLGRGEACFERARSALMRFRNYPEPWTHVVTDGDRSPEEGLVFVAHIEHLGFHSLNSCRVIRVVDDDGAMRRWGFAFGTLLGHEEQGEERFLVTFDRTTGEVRYDVLAFSRPRGPLARLGAPIARALQRRFHTDTCAAMRAAAREC